MPPCLATAFDWAFESKMNLNAIKATIAIINHHIILPLKIVLQIYQAILPEFGQTHFLSTLPKAYSLFMSWMYCIVIDGNIILI